MPFRAEALFECFRFSRAKTHTLRPIRRTEHIRVYALPSNVVLRLLLDQPDALQHVRDVVDAPLAYAELVGGHVEIEDAAPVGLQQRDEALRECAERGVGSRRLQYKTPHHTTPHRLSR